MTDAHEMLRHTLATLAYRAAKACREAPENRAAIVAGQTGLRQPAPDPKFEFD